MTFEKISKNMYKGQRITSLEEIHALCMKKRALYHHWWGMKPAVIFLNQPGSTLVNLMRNGLYTTLTWEEIQNQTF